MKNFPNPPIRMEDRRSGVALIMVLAILSVLIVLAAAFAVTMRTERQAARNSVDGVRGRMLMPAAIRLAMAQLETSLYSNSMVYASANVVAASSTNSASGYYDVTNLYSAGASKQYIPDILRTGVSGAVSGTKWITIADAGNNTVGRFTFVAADCSGFLDANYAIGDPTVGRAEGSIPEEMILHDGTDGLTDVSDQTELYDALLDKGRFENYQEFKSFATAGLSGNPDNFYTFSRYPVGAWDGSTLITRVPLEGDDTALASRSSDIMSALTAMSPSLNAGLVYTNLLDYVDPDQTPRDFVAGCVESVPMYNEFWQTTTLTNIVIGANTNFEFAVSVSAELFYPFVATTSQTFSANIGGVSAKITVKDPGGNTATATLGPTAYSGTAKTFSVNEYFVTNVLSGTVTVNLGAAGVQPTNNTVEVEISIASAEVRAGSTAVDKLKDGVVTTNKATNVQLNDVISSGAECLDPRFNYSITDAAYWKMGTTSSLGATNAWTISFLGNAANNTDGDTAMYVKDAPLYVVGELGYLAIAPWQTIKLYNGGNGIYDPVHDYFTMTTNGVVYGQVNPNTGLQEVLAAVFNQMPVDQFPGDTPSHTVTWTEAKAIASTIQGQQDFTNVSDVIAGNANYVQASTLSGLNNELRRESLFRNAGDLLGTRNNVLTLLMLVQAGEDQDNDNFIDDDEVTATQKAAVIIWRDPYPDGSYHPFFVRQLHRLF